VRDQKKREREVFDGRGRVSVSRRGRVPLLVVHQQRNEDRDRGNFVKGRKVST